MTDGLKLHHHRSVSVYGEYGITLTETGGNLFVEYKGYYPVETHPFPTNQDTIKTLLPALMHYAATGRLPEEPK